MTQNINKLAIICTNCLKTHDTMDQMGNFSELYLL